MSRSLCWRRAARTRRCWCGCRPAPAISSPTRASTIGASRRRPQTNLDNRVLYQPRGRGWGGSSAINGMIYIRGHARDYDQWRQMGLTGWGYADVLPYFKRAQHHEDGADAWNGDAGPLWVSRGPPGNPLYKAFIQAGAQAGYPVTRDFNGHQQEGVGPYHLTIRTANVGALRRRI